jgi:hypothetical protein
MIEVELPQIAAITEADLPAAHRSADRAASQSRRNYLKLVWVDLALILLGTIVTSWAIEAQGIRVALAVAGAVALGLGSLLTLTIRVSNLDKTWFGARAVAESIKTLAWRYMTRADPYNASLTPQEVDERFCTEVDHILQEREGLGASLGGPEALADQITERMRLIRGQNTTTRKDIYLRDRIRDQQAWYAHKGQVNQRGATRWLVAIAVCQALAVVAAILLVRWPEFNLNLASILSSLAAVLMAWLQVRRHQELAHAYGLASHELGLVLARERHVQTEKELSDFVGDAENAISREHTMWLARRDNPLL